MADKFLQHVNGVIAEKQAITSSSGVVDGGKIIALDSTGKMDQSLMPVGIGADEVTAIASESLSAGTLVNLWDDTGTLSARKADASNNRRANGFVNDAKSTGQSVSVYLEGSVTNLVGIVPGNPYYMSETTAGAVSATAPTTAGYLSQEVGYGVQGTAISFEPASPILLA